MERATKKPLEFIQALRGIANLMVVLWHASRCIAPYGTGTNAALFLPGASFGVALFLIISGFIMVHATIRNDGSFHSMLKFLLICPTPSLEKNFDPRKRANTQIRPYGVCLR